ncbi:YeeE/YedE family protein, partial [Myxococcota bacterium]|nr:YeeE/YedE family protein [Myxococcota bacterium]
VDYAALWVPPTYIWPGIIGGLLLGTGFIVGGFCPGTSLTSVATLKIDGFFFVGGMLIGTFIFNDLAQSFLLFFQTSGAMGRVTLMDALGVSTGVIAVGIVLITLGSFLLAEKSEAHFGPIRAKALAEAERADKEQP